MGTEKYLKQKLQTALRSFTEQLLAQETKTIKEPISWPGFEGRVTQRRSGEIATNPRNIVDLGDLEKSARIKPNTLADSQSISWEADHAGIVFFGAEAPGRDWHQETMERTKGSKGLRKIFLENYPKK